MGIFLFFQIGNFFAKHSSTLRNIEFAYRDSNFKLDNIFLDKELD
jgi:hypothetical protein